mgnify:CR=1 FL=1
MWNHRVLAHKDGEDWFFQIHEVYYNDEGKPISYTTNAISVGAESIKDIKWVLKEMKKSLEKPILSVENFPNEWSQNC